MVTRFEGERFSIVFFTARRIGQMPREFVDELVEMGFPLDPTWFSPPLHSIPAPAPPAVNDPYADPEELTTSSVSTCYCCPAEGCHECPACFRPACSSHCLSFFGMVGFCFICLRRSVLLSEGASLCSGPVAVPSDASDTTMPSPRLCALHSCG